MARRTVAQLTADLEAAHVSYQQLRASHDALRAEYDALIAQRAVPAPTRTPAVLSPIRERMAAAKALAMQTGRFVRV